MKRARSCPSSTRRISVDLGRVLGSSRLSPARPSSGSGRSTRTSTTSSRSRSGHRTKPSPSRTIHGSAHSPSAHVRAACNSGAQRAPARRRARPCGSASPPSKSRPIPTSRFNTSAGDQESAFSTRAATRKLLSCPRRSSAARHRRSGSHTRRRRHWLACSTCKRGQSLSSKCHSA